MAGPNCTTPGEKDEIAYGIDFHPFVSPDSPDLSTPQRTVLRTLYWSFGILVWIQGVVVNLLASGVVGFGKLWDREHEVQRRAISED